MMTQDQDDDAHPCRSGVRKTRTAVKVRVFASTDRRPRAAHRSSNSP